MRRFFQWWFGELANLLPDAWRNARKGARVLTLTVSREDVTVAHSDRGKVQELGLATRLTPGAGAQGADGAPASGGQGRESLMTTLRSIRPKVEVCEVVLAGALALSKRVTLPLAAEENLRQVLAFEMERQTPFKAEDVYYDFVVVERDRAAQQMHLDLRVGRKTIVDEALSLLGDWAHAPLALRDAGPGFGPSKPGQPIPLLFQPPGRRASSGRRWIPWLVAVNVLLLLTLLAVPIWQQRDELNRLQSQLREARAEAAQTASLRERVEAMSARNAYLTRFSASKPTKVELLDDLTQRIPDNTYLTRFEVKGDRVSLQGTSQAASSLIAILEDSPWLKQVEYASPVVRQGNTGRERFHLRAVLTDEDVPDTQAPAQVPAQGRVTETS